LQQLGYLFWAADVRSAWLMLIAVAGGIALSDVLKTVFARARPDFVTPRDAQAAMPAYP